jgi:hypothetical protein
MSVSELEKIMNRLEMKLGKTQERKIVVGIDFGTTFSGVAWGNTLDVGTCLVARYKWNLC